jgi:hypothetical protein
MLVLSNNSDGASDEQRNMSAASAWKKLKEDSTPRKPSPIENFGKAFPKDRKTRALVDTVVKAATQQSADAQRAAQQQLKDASRGVLKGTSQAALEELMSDAAKSLAKSLPKIDKVAAAREQLVLVTSTLSDEGQKSRDQNIQVAFESLQAKIANEKAIAESFVIVNQDAASAQRTLEKARAGSELEFGNAVTGEGNVRLVKYHPDSIYIMRARVFVSQDPQNHAMSLRIFLQAVHPRSGQTVLTEDLTTEMMFHPYRMEWVKESPTRSATLAKGKN